MRLVRVFGLLVVAASVVYAQGENGSPAPDLDVDPTAKSGAEKLTEVVISPSTSSRERDVTAETKSDDLMEPTMSMMGGLAETVDKSTASDLPAANEATNENAKVPIITEATTSIPAIETEKTPELKKLGESKDAVAENEAKPDETTPASAVMLELTTKPEDSASAVKSENDEAKAFTMTDPAEFPSSNEKRKSKSTESATEGMGTDPFQTTGTQHAGEVQATTSSPVETQTAHSGVEQFETEKEIEQAASTAQSLIESNASTMKQEINTPIVEEVVTTPKPLEVSDLEANEKERPLVPIVHDESAETSTQEPTKPEVAETPIPVKISNVSSSTNEVSGTSPALPSAQTEASSAAADQSSEVKVEIAQPMEILVNQTDENSQATLLVETTTTLVLISAEKFEQTKTEEIEEKKNSSVNEEDPNHEEEVTPTVFVEPLRKVTKSPVDISQFEEQHSNHEIEEQTTDSTPVHEVPMAETHQMTVQPIDVNPSIEVVEPMSTPEPTPLQTTTEQVQKSSSESPMEPSHSTDESSLFAGDMRNVFDHHHQSGDGDQVEPTVEPEPRAEPQPSESEIPKSHEPQPEPSHVPTAEPEPGHVAHGPETPTGATIKTPFSLRFTNIDFSDSDFDLNSGAARKLHEQIHDDLSQALEATLGENYVGFEVIGFRKGSVIVDGRVLSRDEVGDSSLIAAKLEDTIQKQGGRLGGNNVDLTAVYVDGILSKGGATLRQDNATTAAADSGYILAGTIAIIGLILAFIIFAVIVFGVNSRRKQSRTLKLKEELSMAEHGRSPFKTNGNNGAVNLMSYGNSTPPQSGVNGNNGSSHNSPMLLSSSQFSSPQAYQIRTTATE